MPLICEAGKVKWWTSISYYVIWKSTAYNSGLLAFLFDLACFCGLSSFSPGCLIYARAKFRSTPYNLMVTTLFLTSETLSSFTRCLSSFLPLLVDLKHYATRDSPSPCVLALPMKRDLISLHLMSHHHSSTSRSPSEIRHHLLAHNEANHAIRPVACIFPAVFTNPPPKTPVRGRCGVISPPNPASSGVTSGGYPWIEVLRDSSVVSKATGSQRKRKRPHKSDDPHPQIREASAQKQQRTSHARRAVDGISNQTMEGDINNRSFPINHWVQEGRWPKEYFEQDT
ncbi:MAG: hypothetical protein FRX48_07933 [Lasallia pustulata]|uniref:Uncharacterized protein n=1 Tax=Lasallia pustulata TaxID=136370 RepID=A0A5M8PFT7_9LECA|nr:MAG: hypothetical protein FRX48_07933 [Lasallia pustulata]